MTTTTLEELEVKIKELQDQRHNLLQSQRADKLKEAKNLIRQYGFTASDLGLGVQKTSKTTSSVPPKYRNPANPSQAWTGRGKPPIWIKTHIESGGRKEDYLII